MTERFLVTGGAGYIGSHMTAMLVDQGCEVVVLDNLRQGHEAAVPEGARLVIGNIGDAELLDRVLAEGPWDGVLHFAALSLVGESMREPYRYLLENAAAGISLIQACVKHGVRRFVLSSTANVYASGVPVPIQEDASLDPPSPYGESKLMIERALLWADRVHGMRSAVLRYFNAAGADPAGLRGEDHDPESHLIPLTIDAALGRRPELTVFGADYPTPDGTCIRDYVHVHDLCTAHLAALGQLHDRSVTYNVGNGRGFSVMEVIAAVEEVSGLTVPVRMGERRAGDPPTLVASSARLQGDTGWTPRYAALHDMVRHAFVWRRDHPQGYGDSNRARPD
jgi:UDP-glucose 4-epimerase